MPKILMEAQISKPFDTWSSSMQTRMIQEANGFRVMYRGHKLDEPNTVVILMEGDPSKLEAYMSQPEKPR